MSDSYVVMAGTFLFAGGLTFYTRKLIVGICGPLAIVAAYIIIASAVQNFSLYTVIWGVIGASMVAMSNLVAATLGAMLGHLLAGKVLGPPPPRKAKHRKPGT
jgi:hypothetical protein